MPKNAAVDVWFRSYVSPMKEVVMRIRDIVLGADARIEECIKWQAPTFTFNGNLASFFPKSKQHASLMFHVGARIPGHHPRLEGTGDTSRVLKVGSLREAEAAKAEIEAIVRAWCTWKSADPEGTSPAPAKPAKKAAVAKKAAAAPAKKTAVAKKAAVAKKTAVARKAAVAKKAAARA